MPLRVTFHDSGDADELVTLLTTAGFEAGVVRERFAGDDDGEEVVYVVHTDAPDTEVAELVADRDAWIEESSPLVDGSAADLPRQPRRHKT